MTMLVQPPPRIDFCEITTDQGGKLRARISRPWSLYFDALFARVGGNVAPSAGDIEERTTAAALGVFGRQVQPAQEPADIRYVGAFLPRVTPSQDPADIRYVETFLPRSTPNVQAPDDASSVLCGRVFARR